MPRLALLPAIGFIVVLLAATEAKADVGDWDDMYKPPAALRRSGFAMGATLGAMFGSVSGYPNEAAKVGVERYRASTGPAGGAGGSLWIGAALRDWLVFGIGDSGGAIAGAGATYSSPNSIVLRLEMFPLFYRGGPFQDLGVVGEFGLGVNKIYQGSTETANGGSTSYVALGVLYEPIRAGAHVSVGPTATVGYTFSPTLTGVLATIGVQISYYGGPG